MEPHRKSLMRTSSDLPAFVYLKADLHSPKSSLHCCNPFLLCNPISKIVCSSPPPPLFLPRHDVYSASLQQNLKISTQVSQEASTYSQWPVVGGQMEELRKDSWTLMMSEKKIVVWNLAYHSQPTMYSLELWVFYLNKQRKNGEGVNSKFNPERMEFLINLKYF